MRSDHLCTELLKVNHYKAPRDKLICVLNCCKVIFGLPSAMLLFSFDRPFHLYFHRPDPPYTSRRGCRFFHPHLNLRSSQSKSPSSAVEFRVSAHPRRQLGGPHHSLFIDRYINRFRNPQKLQSEAGYYLSSLVSSSDLLRLCVTLTLFESDGRCVFHRNDGPHVPFLYIIRGV